MSGMTSTDNFDATIPLDQGNILNHADSEQDEQSLGYHSDPEELRVLLSTFSSFYLYRKATHLAVTHARRTSFYALPQSHQTLLNSHPISYLSTLDHIDTCIEHNASLAEAILHAGAEGFNVDITASKGWEHLANGGDVDKARSTIKQFYRDWSEEGAEERERCYGPVIEEVEKRFGGHGSRSDVSILVPGAGLGRLAFELVRRGFTCQGNEFSYHQLMASHFVLNCTDSAEQFTIHPFITSFSHHRSRENQCRAVKIPDIHPRTELLTQKRIPKHTSATTTTTDNTTSTDQQQGVHTQDGADDDTFTPADNFSMTAGEFNQAYSSTDSHETFDCVATVFFIDTAPNIVRYLETIWNVLKEGGVWINLGPLLWHWEGRNTESNQAEGGKCTHSHGHGGSEAGGGDEQNGHSHGHDHSHGTGMNKAKEDEEERGSVELTLEEVLLLVEQMGFKVEERRSVKTGYIEDDRGMLKYDYEAEYWVAIKVKKVTL